MGLEADCTLEWQGRMVKGRALLETEELLFGGPTRLKIRRDAVTSVAVEGDTMRVKFRSPAAPDDTAGFVLGVAAEKWAVTLVTRKSRLDKLGVAAGRVISIVGVDDATFRDEVRERVGAFSDGALAQGGDLVFFGARTPEDLAGLAAVKRALAPTGGVWIIRQKGKGPVTEREVRAAAQGAGLVDVKVVAFSATHTADKFVIPVAARTTAEKIAPKKLRLR